MNLGSQPGGARWESGSAGTRLAGRPGGRPARTTRRGPSRGARAAAAARLTRHGALTPLIALIRAAAMISYGPPAAAPPPPSRSRGSGCVRRMIASKPQSVGPGWQK